MQGMCLHPGRVSAQPATFDTLIQLQGVDRVIAGEPFWPNRTMDLHMLAAPSAGANDDPACMDSTPYGYYMRIGARTDKWIVDIQGGGWCPDVYNCWLRTLDTYVNSTLGSSRNWGLTATSPNFGPRFDDWSYIHLPYCDGSSFSGMVFEPLPTTFGPHGNDTLVHVAPSTHVRSPRRVCEHWSAVCPRVVRVHCLDSACETHTPVGHLIDTLPPVQ